MKLMHKGAVSGPGVWLVKGVHQKCSLLVNKKQIKGTDQREKRGLEKTNKKTEGLARGLTFTALLALF
jgi:hypothetical protein